MRSGWVCGKFCRFRTERKPICTALDTTDLCCDRYCRVDASSSAALLGILIPCPGRASITPCHSFPSKGVSSGETLSLTRSKVASNTTLISQTHRKWTFIQPIDPAGDYLFHMHDILGAGVKVCTLHGPCSPPLPGLHLRPTRRPGPYPPESVLNQQTVG